jgi:hypothetical protein
MSPEQSRLIRRARHRSGLFAVVQALPLIAVVLAASAIYWNGRQEHASTVYYLVGFGVWLVVILGMALSLALGKLVAANSFQPRPRWLYVLFAAGYAVPVAAFARFAADHQHAANQNGWVPVAGGLTAVGCAIACLLMLGRAVARGWARAACYVITPQWLAIDAAPVMPSQPGSPLGPRPRGALGRRRPGGLA